MDKSIPMEEYRIKAAILGDWSTGKTSMLRALKKANHGGTRGVNHTNGVEQDHPDRDDQHDRDVGPTIGVGFSTARFQFPAATTASHHERRINVYMWDTSGTERFRSIITPYLRNVAVVLIVFDVSDRTTWDHVDYWHELAVTEARLCDPFQLPLFTLGEGSRRDHPPCMSYNLLQADRDEPHAVTETEMAAKAREWSDCCSYWKLSTVQSQPMSGDAPRVVIDQETFRCPTASNAPEFIMKTPSLFQGAGLVRPSMTPQQQVATVVAHTALEFDHMMHVKSSCGEWNLYDLPHDTCSLGAPQTSGSGASGSSVMRVDMMVDDDDIMDNSANTGRRKRKCCVE